LVTITLPPAGPVVDFTFTPTSGTVPLTVNFDASASSASSGTITNYVWDFGDGTWVSGVANQTHNYQSVGTFSAKLTIYDSAGNTATVSKQIVVNMPPMPVAAFTYTIDTSTGSIILTADGSPSSSPNGNIIDYTWDWGDGTVDSAVMIPRHTYAAPGTYIVTLYATDTTGAVSFLSMAITVP
jgi:PKD repeat protein